MSQAPPDIAPGVLPVLPGFVLIPAGEFLMGDDEGAPDQRPAHIVMLDAFCVASRPVTNAEYAEFVRDAGHPPPSLDRLPRLVTALHEPGFRDLAQRFAWENGAPPRDRLAHPVTLVRYDDAVAYCEWLGLRTGRGMRLPTEAEWEKAARGGLNGRRYPWGDKLSSARANYLSNPLLRDQHDTQPVGSYPANGYELHDMAGNVWQWVAETYLPDGYARRQHAGPGEPVTGDLRIIRGGAWISEDPDQLRCAHRHAVPADTYAYSIGFRVAYSA